MIVPFKEWLRRGEWTVLIELALVAALAAAAAHWTWIAIAPRTIASSTLSAVPEAAGAGPMVRRELFGAAPGGAAGEAQSGGARSRLKLLGVLSPGSPGAGRAILALENAKPKTVAVGEALAPGVILEEVHRDHVLVSRGGVGEKVSLERRVAKLQ
jgi:hypothetical protein